MKRITRWSVVSVSLIALIALGMPPSFADHNTRGDENVRNIEWVADVPNDVGAPNPINSDMAFWGDLAFQGNFQGFRIIDIADPASPSVLVDYEGCPGGQGDVIIWNDLLVRTWDAPAGDGVTCGGQPVPPGFEGLHLFDVSNPASPTLIGDLPIVGGVLDVFAVGEFYGAAAQFGPPPSDTPVLGELELVDDNVIGAGTPPGTETDACEPLVGFTAGNIALIDRGFCNFNVKVKNAQDAGAVGAIVINNAAGGAGNMTGIDPSITIPSLHVSMGVGATLKANQGRQATISADPAGPGMPGCGLTPLRGCPTRRTADSSSTTADPTPSAPEWTWSRSRWWPRPSRVVRAGDRRPCRLGAGPVLPRHHGLPGRQAAGGVLGELG